MIHRPIEIRVKAVSRRVLACAMMTGALLCPVSSSIAQEISIPGLQEADTARVIKPDTAPAPIPIERVPRRLERDMDRLRQIRLDLSRIEGNSETRIELGAVLEGANAILTNVESVPFRNLPSVDLDNYRQSLERERSLISNRGDELENLLADLETDQRNLQRIQQEWVLTRDSLRIDSLAAPAFQASIGRVLATADSAEVELNKLLAGLLDTGDDLAGAGERIDAVLDQIEETEALHRRQLLIRDAPPLWRPVAVLTSYGSLAGDIGTYVPAKARTFVESSSGDQVRVLIHFLLFVLLLALFLRLRFLSSGWSDDPSLETARHMLSRPYSAAALTALLASNWIYPHASFLLFDIVLVLSLIPVARLLPPLMLKELRRYLYGLLALFLVSRLTTFLPPDSLAHRLSILGLGIGTTVWTLVVLRSYSKTDTEGEPVRDRWHRVVTFALRVGLVGSCLSVFLNVSGWANLSETVMQGMIPSAYVAIVVALGAAILIGVAHGIASGPILNRSKAFRDNRSRVLAVVRTLIQGIAILAWVWGALSWFGAYREILSWFGSILTRQFSIGAVSISLGGILLFLLILWLASWISRIVRVILRDDIFAGLSISPGQADAWATLAQWAILLFGILFAAASAGVGGSQLAVLAGALGVGIGFGLQNIVNNFVSGFILIFEQPIKVGDKIEISSLNLLGDVRRIGIRSSTIHTLDGADVVVPNSNLVQSDLINWTLSDTRRRFTVDIGVAYGTDPQRVIDLLLAVANGSPRALKHPAPVAVFMGFGDSSLNFSLRSWAATFEDSFTVRSEISVAVNNALKEAGIEIPFPQRDLHLRSVAPEAREGLPPAPSASGPSAGATGPQGEPGSPD